jgi:hypothetical protein
MDKLGGIFGWELSGNVFVCGPGGGWAFGFGQEVSFVWILAGILGRGGVCAEGLIRGGVCGDGGGWSFF